MINYRSASLSKLADIRICYAFHPEFPKNKYHNFSMHLSTLPSSPARQHPAWLLAAIGISVLLHGLLLTLPARETLRGISDRPLQVQLGVTEIQPPPSPEVTPKKKAVEKPTPERTDTAVGEMSIADNDNVDWHAEAREVINETTMDGSNMLLEPAPVRRRSLSADNAPARLPGLKEAFSPLQRTRKICATETIIDFGYYSITMPVAYSCTIEEKRAQMEDRDPPEAH